MLVAFKNNLIKYVINNRKAKFVYTKLTYKVSKYVKLGPQTL